LGLPIQVDTGKEFNELVLVTTETKDGFMDILFNKDGAMPQANKIKSCRGLHKNGRLNIFRIIKTLSDGRAFCYLANFYFGCR
jgi:hypothetical protein